MNESYGSVERLLQIGRNDGGIHIHNLPAVPVRPKEIPWHVPASVGEFVNRTAEITMTVTLLSEPSDPPRIVVFSGLRGVGTTATVRRIAHLLRERFPGGQLYIDFATLRHRGGAAVEDAVAKALRDLGVDDSVMPASLDERIRLYRSKTAEQATMMVLDDVGEPEHVRALVPSAAGSVVLATSGSLLTELLLEGAHLTELEPLSVSAAMVLLSIKCGSERISAEAEAAQRLVELCTGLPLALNVAAARLVRNRRLGVGELVRELTDESKRLRGLAIHGDPVVFAVFSTAYRDLPGPAAHLYRRLGLLPGLDFTADVAAILVGDNEGPSRVENDLDTLVDHYLVERLAAGRFQFHPLVRLHAIEVAQDETAARPGFTAGSPDSDLQTAMDYCLFRALQADKLIMGPRLRFAEGSPERIALWGEAFANTFANSKEALNWLAVERANLMAMLRLANERRWWDRVWPLAEVLTALFYNHRHLDDWYESGVLGIEAARRCDRPDAESRLWTLTSQPLLELGRFAEADEALDQAERLAEEVGSALLLGSLSEFRAKRWEDDDPQAAIVAYQRSIEFKTEANRPRGVALSRFLLGRLLTANGRWDEASALLDQAFATFAELKDPRFAARTLAALGVVKMHLGQDRDAAVLLERAVEQLAERAAFHYEAQALESLAVVRDRLGEGVGARACLERALEINRMFGSPHVEDLQALLEARPPGS